MSYLRFFGVCLLIVVSNAHCVVFSSSMLPVSLDCAFLIAPSVFSNVYLLTTRKSWFSGFLVNNNPLGRSFWLSSSDHFSAISWRKHALTLAFLLRSFGFPAPKRLLSYLAFQSFDFEGTWWRLFQKRVVRTKLDIYVFVTLMTLVTSWLYSANQ